MFSNPCVGLSVFNALKDELSRILGSMGPPTLVLKKVPQYRLIYPGMGSVTRGEDEQLSQYHMVR